MFPAGKANFFSEKKIGFSIHSGHKIVVAIVSDFGRGGFACGGGYMTTSLLCQWWRRWGTVEKDKLRDSEVVEKGENNGKQRDDHR